MKKIIMIAGVLAVSASFIFATTTRQSESANKKEHVDYPKEMSFAGEKVPTEIADVQERLDREMVVNMNYHSNTILVIKRANKAFPIIEPILKKNGVPDDFKYLAVIESGLINVVSPAGARGVWQFMTSTAREKGLEVNDYIDERYHLEKSTQAACEYLLEAKEKFGSWTLAAASYNGGMNGIDRRLEEQQVNGYYDLLLGSETSRYVFRILALKEIMQNPEKYNFNINEDMLYKNVPTRSIEIDSTIEDLVSFAKAQGTNYKALKLENPWLRDKTLMNKSRRTYIVKIPTEGY